MLANLQQEYLAIVNLELPSIAVDRKLPVRMNHCFARIVLDNLFGCCWYDRLERRRTPAYKQLTEEQLTAAIGIARSLFDRKCCCTANNRSLHWRGKL